MHDADAGVVALAGEGLLALLVLRLGLSVRGRAPALAATLFVAAALSLVGTAVRVRRYFVDGPTSLVEAGLNAGVQVVAWGLLAGALLRWPGAHAPRGRAAGVVLLLVALAGGLVVTRTPVPNGRWIQFFLGASHGTFVLVLAFLAARLRVRGAPAAAWALPLVGGQVLLVALLWRAAVQVGAATVLDLPAMRLVVAGAFLAAVLAATPAFLALAKDASVADPPRAAQG